MGEPSRRRPKNHVWPPEAARIAQKKLSAVALCEQLMALTGHDKDACWRFLKKHGVSRPGAGKRKEFGEERANSIIEYVSEHGVQAATKRFHCEPKTIYNLYQRYGYSIRQTGETFSLRQICSFLCVRRSQVLRWIEEGLLSVRKDKCDSRTYYAIHPDELRKFCTKNRELLVTRRLSPTRIEFLREYVFAPKHADLLRVRESKKEEEAYQRGEFLDTAS
jgi:hypothetical protein